MNVIEELYKEVEKAYKKGETPVGCIVVCGDKIISKAHNTKQKKHLTINHAEILAISKAQRKLKDWRLNDCKLYVSLEPCKMCKEVIRQSRIKRVYYIIESNFDNEDNKNIEYRKEKLSKEETAKFSNKLQSFFAAKR